MDPYQVADNAAHGSGVTVRSLVGVADVRAMVALFDGIWRPGAGGTMLPADHAVAMAHTGNYLSGAFDGDRLVGAAFGFLAAPAGRVLHSDITGVAVGMRGRGVGLALKLHQRAWALHRQLAEITWTCDPLVRRNAYFNLVKLGARPREYLMDFYGEIDDGINAGQGSDRLLLAWDLAAPDVASRCAGRCPEPDPATLQNAPVALREAADGSPVTADAGGPTVLVQVPPDIERLRRSSPELARRWRAAVRDVLGQLVHDGARVTGFTRSGYYVVERNAS